MPEKSSSHANHNGEAGKVPSEGRLHSNGERNMETSSKNAIENQRNSAAETSEDNADNGLTPVIS